MSVYIATNDELVLSYLYQTIIIRLLSTIFKLLIFQYLAT
jgi:hypothetical protein